MYLFNLFENCSDKQLKVNTGQLMKDTLILLTTTKYYIVYLIAFIV